YEGQQEFLFPCVGHLYKEPVVMVRGEGMKVWDADDREYLDFFSGILSTSLGHCHPRIVSAVSEQTKKLGHTSTLYVTEPQVEAARRLAEITPGNLKRSFFSNSGTEAIETAITLACIHTGRTEVIALRNAYHGRSTLATNLTGLSSWRPLPSSLPNIKHARAPYPYRCRFKTPCDESCAEEYARDLEEVILSATNGQPAAFLAETIQGAGGFVVPPPGYFQRVAEIIRGFGGVLIIDEVQAGFGRTGKWFGIEHWDVVPDIMVMAKGIAGGLPVGATITTDEIAASWRGKTISTFGGNPICMAAMAEALDVMREEDVPAKAEARGAQLRAGLVAVSKRYHWIGDVRGMGLMQAIELVKDRGTKEPDAARTGAFMEAAKAEGILLGKAGLRDNVIRFGPSLLVTKEEVDEALLRVGRACARVGA
ncbi:MAG: aspartate aminotransferase family protein, partial [Longimicrobiales bacterium]|nr:aspartate aminotransferase family protein [Longimicrobiales bacterium]